MEALALYRQGRYGDSVRLAQQQDSPKATCLAPLEAWQPGTRSQRARRASVAEGRGCCWRDLFNTLLLEST